MLVGPSAVKLVEKWAVQKAGHLVGNLDENLVQQWVGLLVA
jgi:hypothetical protein